MERTAATDRPARLDPVVAISCPFCGYEMLHSRFSGPVPDIHRPNFHGRPCKVVVTPDPRGERHRVVPARSSQRLEELAATLILACTSIAARAL